MMVGSKVNWPMVGSVALAVAAGLYVLCGPSEGKSRRKRKRATCPGLVNLGNTCFLNSVLQSWATCASLIQWLGDFVDRRTTEKYSQYLAFSILKTLKVLNNKDSSDSDTYTPTNVIEMLRAHRWVINSDEQDAHELFHVFTETLGEEISHFPRVVSLFDVKTVQNEPDHPSSVATTKSQSLLPALPSRDECTHPFKGSLASCLQCQMCGHKYPVKFESFDSLSLSLPALGGSRIPFTLDQLLRRYVSMEIVQNVSCDHCGKLKQTNKGMTGASPQTRFTKSLAIGKLPQCLCIHVQRTVWLDNGVPVKRYDHVRFPEVLSMEEYIHTKTSRVGVFGGLLFGGKMNSAHSTKSLPTEKNVDSSAFTRVAEQMLKDKIKSQPSVSQSLEQKHYEKPGKQLDVPVVNSDKLTSEHSSEPKVLVQGEKSRKELAQRQFSTQERLYRLMSVVCHMGDVMSGHFVCYRRAPPVVGQISEKWLYTSDESVTEVEFSEVLAASAYMLFYERM